MKKYLFIFLFAFFLLPSCKQEADLRYIAPQVEFAAGQYDLNLDEGTSVDVRVELSRPAATALQMELVFGGTLQEGVHYTASTRKVSFAVGASSANVRLTLLPDTIMDAVSTIDITFFPGDYYTVNQNRHYKTSVSVKKVFHTPVLKLVAPVKSVQSNPFLQETIPMTLESHIPVRSDLSVGLAATTLALGQDLLIDGTTATELVIPAGKTSVDFNLQIAFKDQSGYAKQGSLSLSPGEGYEISGSSGSLSISLADPVVDFSSLLLYAAQHDGAGYRFWQAIKTRSGEWEGNTGYTGLDMGVSSNGSNYLRNYRNMYDHPSFSCRANSSVSNFLRMPELFPNYRSSGDIKILDYGNDRDHRQFSPSDSVLRFVPTPGQALKGVIRIHKPRSFVAFIGDYESWQGNAGAVDWKTDSQQTGGNIFLSTHPAITGTVTLVLEKVEGTYDLTNTSQPILLTAWFRSSSEEFMNGFDTETYDVEQEDGCWKVQYKIWPHF